MSKSLISELRKFFKSLNHNKFIKEVIQNEQTLKNTPEGKILLALAFILQGNIKEAEEFIKNIDEDTLKSAQTLSDLGLVYFLIGKLDKAEKVFKKALNFPDIDDALYVRLAALYYSQNKLEEAQYYWEKALSINPYRVEILYNLGILHLNKGELEKALDYFNRALRIKPDFQPAEEKRTLTLLSLNKIDTLIEEYYKELEQNPSPDVYLKLGNTLYIAGRYPEARAIFSEGVDKYPYDPRLKMALVEVLKEEGRTFQAGSLLKQWLEDPSWIDEEKTPNKEEILLQMRFSLNELRIQAGFLDTAEKDLEEIENKENYPEYYILKAKILMERNRGIEAADILRKGREKFPAHLEILQELAHTLTSIGEIKEAKEIQSQIVAINPTAVITQVELEDYKATDEQIRILEDLLNSPGLPKATRASAGFVLHRVLEKRKEYDRAFEVLIKANDLVKEEINYDWKEHRYMVQKTIEVFTPEVVEKLKGKGHPSERPIFVLGMPRSGTTLTEQILGSHSMVYPAGELSYIPRIVSLLPEALKQVGKKPLRWPEAILEMDESLLKGAAQYYLNKVAKLDDKHPRIVDKLPHNFDYIGLILLMFPNAKIIHLKRNDLDVAVSNYQQNFAAKHGTMGFAFDLKWIGHMLNDHKAIMEHWHKLFPGQIYELDYQRLIDDPKTVIKELLEFCELPWEDNVLEFYKTKRPVKTASINQVRKGIYRSSVEKWRRYEKYLQPVIELLNEGFKPLEEYELLNYDEVVKPVGPIGFTLPKR
jgi:tetratricopeptide (TPR) repeat protein